MEKSSLSLYDLNNLIKDALRSNLLQGYWVVAEILEMHLNRSGHCYMELVEKSEDDNRIRAKAQGTIWARQFQMLNPYFESSTGIKLAGGLKVMLKVAVEFHELYGLSLNITDIDPSYTLGDLARKREEVIRKLKDEGVFDMNRELPFPEVPQRIAIISSSTAAGYGDFNDTLLNNSHGYLFSATLFPATLQGDEAVGSIIRAFDQIFEQETEFDVVVLIRGGGSQADLECFNNYDLAFYVTQFPLPVLTGIGHERDESIADLVAWRAQKTPTAVGEFLIEKALRFEMHLISLQDEFKTMVDRSIREHLLKLDQLGNNLRNSSIHLLERRDEILTYLNKSFGREINNTLSSENERIKNFEKNLQLVHPRTILSRGYSMTTIDGQSVHKRKKIGAGEKMETVFHKGKIISTVDEFNPGKSKSKDNE